MRSAEGSPLRLNGDWILERLDRDADYPDPSGPPMGRVLMSRATGRFMEVAREATVSSDSWLEVPIPDHALHHKWFRAFLGSIGCEDEYFGSIGRWLKDYGSDVRLKLWSNFRSEQVFGYVIATCRRAGIDTEVVP